MPWQGCTRGLYSHIICNSGFIHLHYIVILLLANNLQLPTPSKQNKKTIPSTLPTTKTTNIIEQIIPAGTNLITFCGASARNAHQKWSWNCECWAWAHHGNGPSQHQKPVLLLITEILVLPQICLPPGETELPNTHSLRTTLQIFFKKPTTPHCIHNCPQNMAQIQADSNAAAIRNIFYWMYD